jgi:hypothetical protein
MIKVFWDVKKSSFQTMRVHGELLGFTHGWFFTTYAIVNPLETHIENTFSIWKNHPIKVKLSELYMDNSHYE